MKFRKKFWKVIFKENSKQIFLGRNFPRLTRVSIRQNHFEGDDYAGSDISLNMSDQPNPNRHLSATGFQQQDRTTIECWLFRVKYTETIPCSTTKEIIYINKTKNSM